MSVFDSAIFDPVVFDAEAPIATGSVALNLRVNIVSPHVFSGGVADIKWHATVRIGNIDFSDRLVGKISIQGGEDSARIATVELANISPDEYPEFDGAEVTIDVTLFNGPFSGTWRRFTGFVDNAGEYSIFDRSVSISCSDGWQERSKACTSAAEVHALLGGLSAPCNSIVSWSDTTPDPAAYFDALLSTLPGATCIDSSGLWRVIPWSIGSTPAARFTADHIFDDAIKLASPSRSDLPSAISASLTLRYNRLHAVVVPIQWAGLSYYRLALDGCAWPTKATVQSCIDGLSGWYQMGKTAFTMLPAGSYPVVSGGGGEAYFLVSYEVSQTVCNSMAASMYKRWYQQVDLTYSVDIDMGGSSARDTSISAAISSDFDAGAWESASSGSSGADIYAANAPASTSVTTGYAALPAPFPPQNGALDYYPDLSGDLLSAAARHVVAKATRSAAAGRRKQRLSFSKPLDPRWEIGAILEIVIGRLRALGQLVDFADEMDHDTGDISSALTISVPSGNAMSTGYTVAIDLPVSNIAHAYSAPALGNWIGAATDTPLDPDEDMVLGMLTNVLPGASSYDDTRPVFIPQFRVSMPEISAVDRDPVVEKKSIRATINIAGGVLDFDYGG